MTEALTKKDIEILVTRYGFQKTDIKTYAIKVFPVNTLLPIERRYEVCLNVNKQYGFYGYNGFIREVYTADDVVKGLEWITGKRLERVDL